MACKSDIVGVGVIGVGLIGELHAKVYAQLPTANLLGICDTDFGRARRLAEELDTRAFRNIEELIALDSLQAVSICLPEEQHLKASLLCIEAGKHLLIEKPLAHTLEACDTIIEQAKEQRIKLMVAHILRFDPRYAGVKLSVERHQIGELKYIYARRNNRITDARRLKGRTSILLYLGVHDIDLMHWYTGSYVQEVYAQAAYGLLSDLGVADGIVGLLKFKSGVIATLELFWILPPNYPTAIDAYMELIGSNGTIEVSVREQGLSVFSSPSGFVFPDTLHWPILPKERIVGDLKEELAAFLECIIEDTEPPVDAYLARQAVEVALAIEAALKSGKPAALQG